MATCPVCTTEVDETTAEFQSEYMEETYYFDSSSCKQAFDDNPDVYAVGSADDMYAGK